MKGRQVKQAFCGVFFTLWLLFAVLVGVAMVSERVACSIGASPPFCPEVNQ